MGGKTTGRACRPLNGFETESKTKIPGRETSLVGVNQSEVEAKREIISVAECGEGRVQDDDLKCGTQVCNKDESVARQNSKFFESKFPKFQCSLFCTKGVNRRSSYVVALVPVCQLFVGDFVCF